MCIVLVYSLINACALIMSIQAGNIHAAHFHQHNVVYIYMQFFAAMRAKSASQVIALAIGVFIKNLIVLLITKVFMHFNLPSLT